MTTSTLPSSRPSAGLLRFWASPISLGALAAGCVAVVVLARAVTEVREAGALRHQVHGLAARVAAEESALAYVQSGGVRDRRAVDAGNGLVVETSVQRVPDSPQLRLDARVAERRYSFLFQRLDGGTPYAFGRALTLGPDAVVPEDWTSGEEATREELPPLDAARTEPRDAVDGIAAADPGLALLRLSAGTDRTDYVLGGGKSAGSPKIPDGGVVRVDGNLWVDCGGKPLELTLVRDLTIVVRGNVYLGRSVRVGGAGSLTIATDSAGATPFSDLDGNGRWSNGEPLHGAKSFRGPLEGGGNVYLGMPREVSEPMEFDLGLVCVGSLHVAASQATVHGPLAVGAAGVKLRSGGGLVVATGQRMPSLRRSALPGFAAIGNPRPSALVPVPGDLPLYSAAPAR